MKGLIVLILSPPHLRCLAFVLSGSVTREFVLDLDVDLDLDLGYFCLGAVNCLARPLDQSRSLYRLKQAERSFRGYQITRIIIRTKSTYLGFNEARSCVRGKIISRGEGGNAFV